MTVSAVSSTNLPPTNPFAQFRQAFSQLSNALQAGNLTAAQSAYNTLASSPIAQNSPFTSALSQIGQDLQSGDLADAQTTLASLQHQLQQAHRGHHHHHGIRPPEQSQSAGAGRSNAGDPDGATDGAVAGATTATDSDHALDITA